eukprot:3267361-Pyramimonas_sp.AAC.1
MGHLQDTPPEGRDPPQRGLELLFHHVVRCRPFRRTGMQVPEDHPLEELQVAAQTALVTNISGSAWRSKETSDSVHIPIPAAATCLALSVAADAAAALGYRVGLNGGGLLLLKTPERGLRPQYCGTSGTNSPGFSGLH